MSYEPIGPLQLHVMKYLWEAEKGTVHDTQAAINERRKVDHQLPLAYTTILTVMRNLARRGIVSQVAKGRAHVFTPLISKDEYERQTVEDILVRMFDSDEVRMVDCVRRVSFTIPTKVTE